MKKIIFGILSFLLISPAFAQINPSWSENVAVSFYSSNSDNNITYYIFGNPRNGYDYTLTSLLYVNAPFSLDYVSPIISSINNSDSGTVIYDYNSIFSLGDSLFSYPSGNSYRSIFGMNINNGFVDLSRMGLYLQKNTIGNNGLLKWGSGVINSDSFGVLSNSYVRYFYRDGLGFTNINSSGFIKNPGFAEVFSLNSSYVLTNNSKIYDYAGKNNIIKHYIVPSIYDGYSYIIYSGNDYYFRSVLPGFSSFVSGSSYILPDYLDVSDYLLFRTDGDTLNSSNDKLSVLYKSGGIVYFSNYLCGNLTYTEDSQGLYKINLSTACSFLGGGYFTGSSIFGRSDGLPNIDSIFNNQGKDINTNCGVYRFRGNYLSLQFESNGSDNFLSSRSFINLNSCPSSLYYTGTLQKVGFRFISDSSINLLSNFDNTFIPLSPEESRDRAYDIICKLNPNNPICKEFGYTTGSYDVSFTPDGSGGLLATVTLYDQDDGSCPDIYFTGSDGVFYHQYFDRVCYNVAMIPREDSAPQEDLTSELTGLENNINLAFSGIVGENFKFYSCPFNSPLKAFHLSSIGGLSSFLLDKFFDVNLVGPFNCLLGGILYSETDSVSLGSRLLSDTYHGEKYLNNFPEDVKKTINWLLFAGMVLFFWSFRPKDH